MPPRTNIPALTLAFGLLTLTQGIPEAIADTSLSAVGQGRVSEIAHRREIQLSEGSIDVAETITLANPGRLETEAIYSFRLPAEAAIYEMTISNPEGGKSRYGVVDASAATRLIADPDDENQPDLGLLRMVSVQGQGEGAERGYELRVYPIPGQKSSTVLLRWRSPVSLVAGSYSVRIPGRGEEAKLARSEVVLRSSIAAGELYGGDTGLAASTTRNKRYRFFAPAQGDLVIQAKARISKARAHAEVALYPLTADSGVAALRVVVPGATRGVIPRFKKALVLVDVSRSMGKEGLNAASKFVDALLAQLGEGTQVEAVLFHRSSSRVLGEMRSASASVRGQIVREIRSTSVHNGSNLEGALTFARGILEAEEEVKATAADTLIAVVTDGILASDLDEEEAIAALGPRIMEQSRILSALLVPPDAPLPSLRGSALSALAYRGRGRVAALHHNAATLQGKALLGELTQPEPLETLEVELDRGQWVGANLVGPAAPGMSVTALGYYQGGTPRRVTVEALQGGKKIQLVAQKLPRAEAKAFAQMTLANTSSDSFPGDEEAVKNRRAFIRAAAKLGVVTEASAGVVVDKSDGFASDRLAMATRWGGQYYRRLPPPAERDWKLHNSFRPFEVDPAGYADGDNRTGQLDRKIITRRVRTHAIPIARRCYDRLLRQNHEAKGAVRLRIEISRGEVHHVHVARIALGLEPIRECIVRAVYQMPIPRVLQGSDPEFINLVNYPLRFRLRKPGTGKTVGKVEEEDLSPAGIDTSDPLSGIPD